MSLIKKVGLRLQKIYRKILFKLDSLKGTREEIAKGFATGVAVSFTPFIGFHMLLCIAITKLTKQNGIAGVLGTIVGNPWTFPVIWYLTMHIGDLMLGGFAPKSVVNFKELFSELFHTVIMLDIKSFMTDIWPVFFPMLIGSIPFYIIFWQLSYRLTLKVLLKNTSDKGGKI